MTLLLFDYTQKAEASGKCYMTFDAIRQLKYDLPIMSKIFHLFRATFAWASSGCSLAVLLCAVCECKYTFSSFRHKVWNFSSRKDSAPWPLANTRKFSGLRALNFFSISQPESWPSSNRNWPAVQKRRTDHSHECTSSDKETPAILITSTRGCIYSLTWPGPCRMLGNYL